MGKRLVGVVAVLVSTIVAFGPSPAGASGPAPAVPQAGQVVPGQFIVTLQPGADARQVAAEYERAGVVVDHVYTSALNGFAGRMSDAAVSDAREDRRVQRVEPDRVVLADETTQSKPTWGLDRVDDRLLPLDGAYTYDTTASNVTAYILDTGIRASHVDFGGRVSGGYTAVSDGNGTNDCHGHGTHVAGTVGGATWGVAKAVKLVPVRVLDCNGSGTWSGVIAGVDWVTKNAVKPAVANMSLGGGANSSVDDAVRASIGSGVTYALSAGNDSGGDACTKSPARVAEGLTVASTDKTDTRSSFSNIGTCVDLFAPGSSITSAYASSDTATATMSGTSMSAPHVAGVAALHLAVHTSASAAAVGDAVVGNATKDLVQSAGTGSPNLLLHSRWATEVVDEPTVTTGTLAGTITSSAGGALSGATVSAGGLTTTTTTTDTAGAYSLTLAEGSYTVTASATGHDPASATATVTSGQTTTADLTLTAQETTSTAISLSARGYKVKGSQKADLTWSGATSTSVDVFRDGAKITTTANDGAHTDSINTKGGGTYTYTVCEAGTATCSDPVTVTF